MKAQPTLNTARLILRPFYLSDAESVTSLAGDKRIADMTASIPHPYPEGLATTWISDHMRQWTRQELAAFAIVSEDTGILIGCISIMIRDISGELGYWLGTRYWNKGYATEACREILTFCFAELKLQKVHAQHLSRNPASGAVLIKAGLSHIGSGEAKCGYRRHQERIELYEQVFDGKI